MNTIFAIYYNDNCYYIGYTNNLEKRLKDLTKKSKKFNSYFFFGL